MTTAKKTGRGRPKGRDTIPQNFRLSLEWVEFLQKRNEVTGVPKTRIVEDALALYQEEIRNNGK